MFKFSFNSIPTKREKEEDFPLITALNFGNLKAQPEVQVKPIVCSSCGSLLLSRSDLQPSGDGYKYACQFCLHTNSISKEIGDEFLGKVSDSIIMEGMTQANLAILLEDIRDGKDGKKEEALKGIQAGGEISGFPIQIAVIDISGSMAGGKIEAVKHALVQNIHELTADNPKVKFILVPFSSDVDIYTAPDNKLTFEDGPSFFKPKMMAKEVEKIIEKYKFKQIEDVYKGWVNIVKNMRDLSMTALGPAFCYGINLIVKQQTSTEIKAGGKILLLTDGLANVGIGSIESSGSKVDKHKNFYTEMAKLCLDHNIVVDMVGVRDNNGGNSVALDIIGKVTDFTGGSMSFVTADQIEAAFGSMQKTSYVARNVELRFFAPEGLNIEEIQGAEVLQSLNEVKAGDPIRLGALYADREIYVKFKQGKSKYKPGQNIPIQLQLNYLDDENKKQMRVIRQNVKVTEDKEEFERNFDAKVATAYELSKASKARSRGDLEFAKKQAQMSLSRNQFMESQYAMDYSEMNELIADEEDEWQAEEAEMARENIADKKSFRASMGQSRYRSSMDMKLKRMKNKKK